MFPKLRRRSPHGSCDSVSDKEDDEATDYVFRILFPGNQMEFSKCFQASGSLGTFPPDAFVVICYPCGGEEGVSVVMVLLTAYVHSGPGADRAGREHVAADAQKVVLLFLLTERLLQRLPA